MEGMRFGFMRHDYIEPFALAGFQQVYAEGVSVGAFYFWKHEDVGRELLQSVSCLEVSWWSHKFVDGDKLSILSHLGEAVGSPWSYAADAPAPACDGGDDFEWECDPAAGLAEAPPGHAV